MQKKIPLRKCTGCGESKTKKELIRVVRSPEGDISIDRDGKKPGRGAYVCPKKSCLEKARKARRIERSLETEISDAVYDRLSEEIENGFGA